MSKQAIQIEVPEGFEPRYNEETQKIEFVKKDDRPKSWEEYERQVKDKDAYSCGRISCTHIKRIYQSYFDSFACQEEAEAFIALGQLIQLRDAWWNWYVSPEGVKGWKPNWENTKDKYTIYTYQNRILCDCNTTANRILVFPTIRMRNEFLDCFKSLINQALPLL